MLNGEAYRLNTQNLDHNLETNPTLADLLSQLQLTHKRVAVELNQQIIPRSQHASTILHTDDQIEIVHAIGGGLA